MQQTEQNESDRTESAMVESNEERLRREVESLKRQLEEHKRQLKPSHAEAHVGVPHPSRSTLMLIVAAILVLVLVAFFAGYAPRRKREGTIVAEASAQSMAIPTVNVTLAERSDANSAMVLPGNVQAIAEAPILARSDGYVKKRYADIGDRVRKGQVLAEIEAPELDQQVTQGAANLQQTEAALEQANANYQQGKANEQLAKVTATRWQHLASKGAVSLQENDQYQAQYQAQVANLTALEKAVAAARSNIAAMQANLARLKELQSYEKVTAPFSGIITVRNIDAGALISANSTLLFRIAQTDRLRVYVNVPQANVAAVRTGQQASLDFSEIPGREFAGTVTRTANALDPSSRTLLTEVQVANPDGVLFPGMYAQVKLDTNRIKPPLLIPGDALITRASGTLAAVVSADHVIHLQNVTVGRDYGNTIEVANGLEEGDAVVVNPTDVVREGAKVNPVPISEKPAAKGAGAR